MATISIVKGGTSGYPAHKKTGTYKIERKVDIAALIATGWITTQLVQNDILQAINVPANSYVLGVGYQLTTAATQSGSGTVEVGDGDDPNGYIVATAFSTVQTTPTVSFSGALTVASPSTYPNSSEAYTVGKFYTAADTIDLKFPASSNITAGVFKVFAIIVDCNFAV